jgi:DNA repair protein RadA/Sms
VHARWSGRCSACGEWNCLVEEAVDGPAFRGAAGPALRPQSLLEVDDHEVSRLGSGIREFDRVLGGGLVPGGSVLVGGDPGVGKSTLLLEVAAHRAGAGSMPLYVTAEESVSQVALRARRLGLTQKNLMVVAEERLEAILDLVLDDPPDLVVIDSIQTVRKAELGSAAGSVAQVRECAADLVAAARRGSFALILVGHVTKEGLLAGPRVLEHLVDAVLYFEGERDTQLRVLRAVKNRHGPAGELAVFAMSASGLTDPDRPAGAFLGVARGLPGAVVTPAVEGTRVFLVEIQALTSRASYGPARVRANGIDPNRATMLAAVLNRRAGLALFDQDLYVNVVGGLKLTDPGCDLAVCLAIASSFFDRPLEQETIAFGEVGLGGEVRGVRSGSLRLREAAALGFRQVLAPEGEYEDRSGMELKPIRGLAEAIDLL